MIRTYFEFIKISHTVFALPFCLIAFFQASRETGFSAARLVRLVVTFTAARAFAMAVNRIADREIDAQNPRTAGRHLPTGEISPMGATLFAAGCSIIFIAGAFQFNPLCGFLSPVVLAYLAFYSWTKRFTTWSHLVLGGALGLAPLAAELAVLGRISPPTVYLAMSVLFWVAGFDVVYAMQDIDFDRRAGLYSLPSRVGPERAHGMAMGFHAAAFALFLAYGAMLHFGPIYFGAQTGILLLLIYEHALVFKKKIETAFFQMNGIVSVLQVLAVGLEIWRSGRM